MPTVPHPDLVPETEPGVQQVLSGFSVLLDEVVAFGTHLLRWSIAVTTKGGGDENVPRWTLFRRFLELLDGLSAQVTRGSSESANVTTRATLECALNILYLLEADHHRRAVSYLVAGVHSDLKFLESLDPTTDAGRQLREVLAADRFTKTPKQVPDLAGHIASLKAGLTTGAYRPVEEEYQRIRRSGNRNPAWHALFDGPRNVADLARHLQLGSTYAFLYRPLSGSTHSANAIKGALHAGPDGRAAIPQLRMPVGTQSATSLGVGLALVIFQGYCGFYTPEHGADLAAWYPTIQTRFLQLSGPPLIVLK